jgi:hypothetical protein
VGSPDEFQVRVIRRNYADRNTTVIGQWGRVVPGGTEAAVAGSEHLDADLAMAGGRELSAVPQVLEPRGRRTERCECIATPCGEYSYGFTACRTYMSSMGRYC